MAVRDTAMPGQKSQICRAQNRSAFRQLGIKSRKFFLFPSRNTRPARRFSIYT
jgi:hypothetical protein